MNDTFLPAYSLTQPTISVLNGYALGGGLIKLFQLISESAMTRQWLASQSAFWESFLVLQVPKECLV